MTPTGKPPGTQGRWTAGGRTLGRRAAVQLGLSILAGCACTGCDNVRLDEHLCPVGRTSPPTTLLLLDTSDPLEPKHREEFQRLIREMQSGPADADDREMCVTDERASERPLSCDLWVKPGEQLVVYELSQDLARVEPELRVCNPGDHPDDWGFERELTRGKMIALRQWQRFQDQVEPLFAREEATPQARSPIIEFLGVIVPRHAPSTRMGGSERTHLIVYSDLLQHSDGLSHYGPHPEARAVRETAEFRHLQTDLSRVEVSLYRLERKRDARWQTNEHYYWWTKLVQAFGGRVIHQESV